MPGEIGDNFMPTTVQDREEITVVHAGRSGGESVLRLGKATPDQIELLVDAARRADLTYPVPGATRDPGNVPAGYRFDESECMLGGPAAFDRARGGLQTWQAHVGAGVSVVSRDLAAGETVLVLAGFGPLQVVAPCRVVYVVDEPDCFGFAYGTLPGHPEEGEEAFVIQRRGNGSPLRAWRAISTA